MLRAYVLFNYTRTKSNSEGTHVCLFSFKDVDSWLAASGELGMGAAWLAQGRESRILTEQRVGVPGPGGKDYLEFRCLVGMRFVYLV